LCGFESDSKVNYPEKSVLTIWFHLQFLDLFVIPKFIPNYLAHLTRCILLLYVNFCVLFFLNYFNPADLVILYRNRHGGSFVSNQKPLPFWIRKKCEYCP
jgi:hypothetical protein